MNSIKTFFRALVARLRRALAGAIRRLAQRASTRPKRRPDGGRDAMARGFRRGRVDAEREPSLRETVDDIVRRLESESAASPDRPDHRDDLGGPSRVDARDMAALYGRLGVGTSEDPRAMADAGGQAIASLARDPGTRARYFATERYPFLPPEERTGRYGVKDDRVYRIAHDGTMQWEEPSLNTVLRNLDSGDAWFKYGSSWLGEGIPTGAAIAGSIVGPWSAGLGAAAGDLLRQYLANRLLGEKLSPARRVVDPMIYFAGGYTGERLARHFIPEIVGSAWADRYLPPIAVGFGTKMASIGSRAGIGTPIDSALHEVYGRSRDWLNRLPSADPMEPWQPSPFRGMP